MQKTVISIFSLLLILILSCQNSPKDQAQKELSKEEISTYIKRGNEIAGQAGGTLAANLINAMQEGGVEKAVPFCNFAASPLIDSLESVWDAEIRRSSMKVRNPDNTPDFDEQVTLKYYSDLKADGQDLFPIVKSFGDDSIAFYAPIILQPLCLNCHGTPSEDIAEADYSLIQSYYPEDKAIGFEAGDLRGIWSIRFER